jgi:hypothetical protein
MVNLDHIAVLRTNPQPKLANALRPIMNAACLPDQAVWTGFGDQVNSAWQRFHHPINMN